MQIGFTYPFERAFENDDGTAAVGIINVQTGFARQYGAFRFDRGRGFCGNVDEGSGNTQGGKKNDDTRDNPAARKGLLPMNRKSRSPNIRARNTIPVTNIKRHKRIKALKKSLLRTRTVIPAANTAAMSPKGNTIIQFDPFLLFFQRIKPQRLPAIQSYFLPFPP